MIITIRKCRKGVTIRIAEFQRDIGAVTGTGIKKGLASKILFFILTCVYKNGNRMLINEAMCSLCVFFSILFYFKIQFLKVSKLRAPSGQIWNKINDSSVE